jgi:hypothetical protein
MSEEQHNEETEVEGHLGGSTRRALLFQGGSRRDPR